MALLTSLLIGQGVSLGARALGSLFGGESDREKQLKRLKQSIASLKGYTSEDKADISKGYDKAASSYTTQALNNAGLSTAGKQNAKAAVIANVAPGLAMKKADVNFQMEQFNQNLDVRKVGMEAGLLNYEDADTPQQDFLSTVGMGLQIGMGVEQLDQLDELNSSMSAAKSAAERFGLTDYETDVPNLQNPQGQSTIGGEEFAPSGNAIVEGIFPANKIFSDQYSGKVAPDFEQAEIPSTLSGVNPFLAGVYNRKDWKGTDKQDSLMTNYLDTFGSGG